jgi:phospholipase/carboxylesterase
MGIWYKPASAEQKDMTERDDAMRWGPAEAPARQLVFLLHGLGADGADLIDLAPTWAKALPHAAFVSPHAPDPYIEAGFGRQWFPLQDRNDAARAGAIESARLWLDRFIDAECAAACLSDYALMGFSQGAMMALHTGLRRAPAPKAILAFSGRLLFAERLGEATAHPPILLVHGMADEVVPVGATHHAQQTLGDGGFSVEALICPGLGHGIDDAGLAAGAIALQKAFAQS